MRAFATAQNVHKQYMQSTDRYTILFCEPLTEAIEPILFGVQINECNRNTALFAKNVSQLQKKYQLKLFFFQLTARFFVIGTN